MPKLHNPNWNELKLSDFPQFKCLCELCDCGCFERSKQKHSDACKNRVTSISNAFVSDFINKPKLATTTSYTDTYKRLDGENTFKRVPNADTINIIDKNAKFSTNTTNKDHFKSWISDPAKRIAEYPEITSRLIYPENKRRFRTTNEDMFMKNYGPNYAAHSTAINLFDQTFRLNQGNMSFSTVYTDDFKKQQQNKTEVASRFNNNSNSSSDFENRHRKMLSLSSKKFPMETLTQHKYDFKPYEPAEILLTSASFNGFSHADLFKSNLTKSLTPRDDNNVVDGGESSWTGDVSSSSRNRKIKFITTFENRLLPKLRIIRELPASKKSNNSSSTKNEQRKERMIVKDIDDEDEDDNVTLSSNKNNMSTYRYDYQDRGVDVCMAKAYNILAAKKSLAEIKSS